MRFTGYLGWIFLGKCIYVSWWRYVAISIRYFWKYYSPGARVAGRPVAGAGAERLSWAYGHRTLRLRGDLPRPSRANAIRRGVLVAGRSALIHVKPSPPSGMVIRPALEPGGVGRRVPFVATGKGSATDHPMVHIAGKRACSQAP